MIVFDIGDRQWTLDLSSGNGSIKEGQSDEDADVTLSMSGAVLSDVHYTEPIRCSAAMEIHANGPEHLVWNNCTIALLACADDTFDKLVNGKTNPQQAFLFRKLKIKGAIGMAMKVVPVLSAAKGPVSKL